MQYIFVCVTNYRMEYFYLCVIQVKSNSAVNLTLSIQVYLQRKKKFIKFITHVMLCACDRVGYLIVSAMHKRGNNYV